MSSSPRTQADHLHALSTLMLSHPESHSEVYEYCCALDEGESSEFKTLAGMHHCVLRASQALADFARNNFLKLPAWINAQVQEENRRVQQALSRAAEIAVALEHAGFPVVILKSLDHWPDFGSDIDVYTSGVEAEIRQVLKQRFSAKAQPQSWSDRLARKWTFSIPDLDEVIDVHIGRLGQTGEQVRLGRNLLQRRVKRNFAGHKIPVPSTEDQLIVAVLNRFYRHYCLRICDVANTAHLLQGTRIDFNQLKREAKQAGIKPGLSTYLSIIDQYYLHYRGEHLHAPAAIVRSASFGVEKVYAHAGMLRIPLFPQSTKLFTRGLAKAMRRKDLKKSLRLGLQVPLAAAAGTKFRITGSDKGIW